MCQADFLSDRNPWWLPGYKSQWSWCFPSPTSCLVGKVMAGKKACVWQQRQMSRWQLPNSCLCVGSPGICNESAFLRLYVG
jgi:hypothetical protein